MSSHRKRKLSNNEESSESLSPVTIISQLVSDDSNTKNKKCKLECFEITESLPQPVSNTQSNLERVPICSLEEKSFQPKQTTTEQNSNHNENSNDMPFQKSSTPESCPAKQQQFQNKQTEKNSQCDNKNVDQRRIHNEKTRTCSPLPCDSKRTLCDFCFQKVLEKSGSNPNQSNEHHRNVSQQKQNQCCMKENPNKQNKLSQKENGSLLAPALVGIGTFALATLIGGPILISMV